MEKFKRGVVVYHKVMGKGVVIDTAEGGMFKVRMANGVVETYYPEELETEDEVQAKAEEVSRQINAKNRNMWE